LAKVNYQYQKRQKELAKKRKKEQKQRLKELKKNNQEQGTQEAEDTQAPLNSSEEAKEAPSVQPQEK
jgi:hypothetical protein